MSCSEPQTTTTREATLNRNGNGEPLGVAIFLNDDDLRDLDVDVDDANAVSYVVTDGELRLQTE